MSVKVGVGGVWTTLAEGAPLKVGAGGTFRQVQNIKVGVGGVWTQVWQYDVTAPSVRAFTVTGQSDADMRFAWSGGALVTDSGSGVASVKIQRQYTTYAGSAEGWTDVQTLLQAEWEATSGSFDFAPTTAKRHQRSTSAPYADTVTRYYMGFRVVAVDNVGLTTTTAEVKALTKPYGTIVVVPVDTGWSYNNTLISAGVWLNFTNGKIQCGDGSGSGSYNCLAGGWAYGTGIAEASDGYTPASATVYIQRYGAQGVSGSWNLQYHDKTVFGGADPTFAGTVYVASISGTDDFETCAFPAGWLTAVANGTLKGVGLVKNGSSTWRVLRGYGEGSSNSGKIELVFS